jgi:hypothetical protein
LNHIKFLACAAQNLSGSASASFEIFSRRLPILMLTLIAPLPPSFSDSLDGLDKHCEEEKLAFKVSV